VTAYLDGFHGDNNLTVFYGEPDHPDKLRVAHAAQQALYAAIGICRPGLPINQLGKAI
jgi:methionyl aminopeptidase